MSDTDLQLLARYTRQHAEDAFAEIVHRHLNLVYSAALRLVRSPQLAEEVAQCAFTDLARNAHSLASNTILTAWLYKITRRTAIDVVRHEARRQIREQVAHELTTMNAAAADWTQIEPILDEAMHALDDTDRAAVLLRYFENKSLREIGATLGTSDDAAQKRVGRAVERLREFFAKRGVTVGATGLGVVISANAVQAAPVGLVVTVSTAALAGTAIAGTTVTAVQAIAMTTLQKALITTALAIAVGTGIYEARQASTLRKQVQMRQQEQAKQSQQLTSEREDATRQLAALRDDNVRLNRNTAELLKLRGEATRLREMEQQVAQLKKTPQSANEPTKARTVAFGTELRDLGATTPERAASSLIWATTEGQRARVSELLELPKGISEEDAPRHYEFFTKQLSNVFSGMEFTSVQGIKPNSDGTLRLNFIYRDIETGKTNPFPFMLRLRDSGWKVVVEGEPPNERPQN